jgi:Sulfotransferase family
MVDEPVALDGALDAQPGAAMIVCILGMHRSGTSLVARMLNLLGIDLGPERSLWHASDDNPKGFWEHQPLARINDEIFARYGGSWERPEPYSASWPRDPLIADLRDRARQLLADDFGSSPLWGWKDPRTCLTLPFWQELTEPMRYVICLRNPCAVIASLGRRSGMTPDWADRLWLTYVQASLIHTSGQPRMFVFYEDVVQDWDSELRRLATFIGHPERADDPVIRAGVAEFFDQELCHHRMTLEDLVNDQRISFPSKSLFVGLRGHAPREVAIDAAGQPDRATRSINKTLDVLANWSLDTWHRTAALANERDTLSREREQLTESLRELQNSTPQRMASGVRRLVAALRRRPQNATTSAVPGAASRS